MSDKRFFRTDGVEAYTGNELIVKGALEAGVGLVTGYPGSPVSDVFDVLEAIAPQLAERGMVAQIANNEGLATARLNGARQAGLRGLAVMKSVGLHVGADALAVGNLMEARRPEGGAVVVVGDDPWNETTQINSDSRYLSKHLHMPVVEPATFQELKDWLAHAFTLSGASDLYVTYVVTTNQADGGATVRVRPHPDLAVSHRQRATLRSADIAIRDAVMIPPHTSMREATLAARRERFLKTAAELGLNRRFGPKQPLMPVGFVASGLAFCYLKEVLQMIGLWRRVPVLKLGVTYPLDRDVLAELAGRVEHLVVVEEKRGFLEEQVANALLGLRQEGRVPKTPALWGKRFPNGESGFPEVRGLNVSLVLKVLGPAFLRWKEYFPTLDEARIVRELSDMAATDAQSMDVPLRTPTFCPGCPHRDSAVVSMKMKNRFQDPAYMKAKSAKPVDVLFHGESGCHSMLQFAPNEGLMQNYSGMGLGGGTGAGMSPFVTNKQVVFLGDSTFFHSGVIAISDAVKNSQDITFVILENQTTAMTGHQPTPGNDWDITGNPTPSQDIERLLRGLIPPQVSIARLNPAERERYQALLEETVLRPGVKIIIADKECAITLNRRLRAERKREIQAKGFLPVVEKINVATDTCEYCLSCTRETACPGLAVVDTQLGPKIQTDLSTCVDDGACARVKACPSFERVTIRRRQAPAPVGAATAAEGPLPDPPAFEPVERWSAYTAGVGGMGAGVVNAVLVRAGMRSGYHVVFLDKKGLAVRNGGVYGHMIFSRRSQASSPVIPYGKADVLIGLDLLEAARAVDGKLNLRVAHPARSAGVVNTHKNETVLSLIGQQNLDVDRLEAAVRERLRPDAWLAVDFSDVSERRLGSKLFANMMIVGAAFQRGWIPLKEEDLVAAVAESVPPLDRAANVEAFRIGRMVAVDSSAFRADAPAANLEETVEQNAGRLERRYLLTGRRLARYYRGLMSQVRRWIDLPRDCHELLARTIYDLIRHSGCAYAEHYVALIWNTFRRDRKAFDYRATRAVIPLLYRAMAIKDEVWVSELLTSPEKYEADRRRFNIDPERGDKISYVHLNRPAFTVFGKTVAFDIETRDWMLSVMRRMRFLRKVLPGWHAEEQEFRRWYERLVADFAYFGSQEDYDAYVAALETADAVRGFRDVRFPLMAEARRRADAALEKIGARSAGEGARSAPASVKGSSRPS